MSYGVSKFLVPGEYIPQDIESTLMASMLDIMIHCRSLTKLQCISQIMNMFGASYFGEIK